MKSIISIVLATFLLASCQSPAPAPGLANEKLIRQFYEYFNQHNWTKMAGMYAEVAEFKDPSFGPGMVKQTRQQTIDKYSQLNAVFPDIKDEITQIYLSGDKHVIVEFISSGTAPDSSRFELPICTVFTIENGLITKDFTYYDNFEEPAQ